MHLLWDFCDFTLTAGPRKMLDTKSDHKARIKKQTLFAIYFMTSQDVLFFFFKQKVYTLQVFFIEHLLRDVYIKYMSSSFVSALHKLAAGHECLRDEW